MIAFARDLLMQTSAVVAIAWLCSVLLARRHPALRHALWLSALCCVLASPALLLLRPAGPVLAPRAEPEMIAHLPALSLASAPVELGELLPAAPKTSPAAGASEPARRWSIRMADAIVLAWALGALLLALRLAHGWRQARTLCRLALAVDDPRVLELADRAASLLGTQAPRLAISPALAGPIVVGLVRPVILLPEDLVHELADEQLHAVLVHETAHVVRRDAAVGLVQRLIGIAAWPHPLIHLLNRELSDAREEVCDNHVLGTTERTTYARVLLASTTAGVPVAPLGATLWPRRMRLARRIQDLLDSRRRTMTRIGTLKSTLVAASFALVALLVAPPAAAREPDAIDLSGTWRGPEWGSVTFHGEIGSYRDGRPSNAGVIAVTRTGRRGFSGFWKESDACGGTLSFTVGGDGRTLTGSYRVDEQAAAHAGEHGKFTLERVGRSRDDREAAESAQRKARDVATLVEQLDEERAKSDQMKKLAQDLLASHDPASKADVADLLKQAVTSDQATADDRKRLLQLVEKNPGLGADELKRLLQNQSKEDALREFGLDRLLLQKPEPSGDDRTEDLRKLLKSGLRPSDPATLDKLFDELKASELQGTDPTASISSASADRDRAVEAGHIEFELRKAVEDLRKQKGTEHPETAAMMQRLAQQLAQRQRYDEAQDLMKQAVAVDQKMLGREHTQTLSALAQLGDLYRQRGRTDEATSLLRKVLEAQRQQRPDGGREQLETLECLAAALADGGRANEAEAMLRDAIARRQSLGDDAGVAGTLEQLARVLEKLGRTDEAKALRAKAKNRSKAGPF